MGKSDAWCKFDWKKYLSIPFGCFLMLITACQNQMTQHASELKAKYLIDVNDLPDYEANINHRSFIEEIATWDDNGRLRNKATTIYRSTCYSCHGNNEQPGSLPDSKKFWSDTFRNGNDPYSMYQTISRGFGLMPPQLQLAPEEKYAVIAFIREELIKPHNPQEYYEVTEDYLFGLPAGESRGPEPTPYHPWSDMDYGNWLIRCYEMADGTGAAKIISGGRAPLPNEDYRHVNFAYKGIAMRLDEGEGGIAAGDAFALFDHDLLRFVGFWTGKGFIDWEDILLDDQHNVYPRTVGQRQFANPITPGWADPETGSFADPRFRGSDGRPFGPLPRAWAHYKGLYRYDNKAIISYTVGPSTVLEMYDLVVNSTSPVLARTIQIQQPLPGLKVRLAPDTVSVMVHGTGVQIRQESGYHIGIIQDVAESHFTAFLSSMAENELIAAVETPEPPTDLTAMIHGDLAQYPKELMSPILTQAGQDGAYVVDVLTLPQNNPWKSRLRPTGIDFLKGGQEAVVSTIDGEVWHVKGILGKAGEHTTWRRIATGLFQPLGIKVLNGDIYVTCRDQICILRDLNGDGETDFYESFNSDHQVTEHFHEFAMGLQTDEAGNFYYAKSGRHARTSLVPQHGTLIKVSADGRKSEILANGFRAANGVCINPDGSFYVTDQQGYWNPMNRINRVTQGGFYGNMWGYGAPADSSDAAMIQPMCWIDMKYDRSPSELLWVESGRWGPLNGSLLNLSYGYGKIFVVYPQKLDRQEQGGMIELPVAQFPTGIMRGRFNPSDGQLYVCGMAAWATSRMIQVGGFYRIRYTDRPLLVPISMVAEENGIRLIFNEALDPKTTQDIRNYEINTWDIVRSKKYGSDRFNEKSLKVREINLSEDAKSILIEIPEIKPTWIMEIKYQLRSATGIEFKGALQNSIYGLEKTSM